MKYSTFIVLAATVFCQCDPNAKPCSFQCFQIGFSKGSDPDQSCTAPIDCQVGLQCNPNFSSACTVIGYQNMEGVCVLPTDNQCLNPANQLCSSSLSVCITQNGFQASLNANTCVTPDNCQAKNTGLCGSGKSYCINQGFSKSTDSNDCVCDTTKNTFQNNQCIPHSKSTSHMLINYALLGLIIAIFI